MQAFLKTKLLPLIKSVSTIFTLGALIVVLGDLGIQHSIHPSMIFIIILRISQVGLVIHTMLSVFAVLLASKRNFAFRSAASIFFTGSAGLVELFELDQADDRLSLK